MVIMQVYSECIKIKYKSTLLSKATICLITTRVVSILVPYLIVLYTQGT